LKGSVVTSPPFGRPELPTMVRVEGGVFTMGQAPIFEAEAPNPPHDVRLSPFWMGVHPVTCAEHRAFLIATGAPAARIDAVTAGGFPNLPVVNVSHREAVAYCARAGGTLPTEAMGFQLCVPESRLLSRSSP